MQTIRTGKIPEDMPKETFDYITHVIVKLMETYKSTLDHLDEKIMNEYYTFIITSILGSFTATMMNIWAENVTDPRLPTDQYKEKFVTAITDITGMINKSITQFVKIKLDYPVNSQGVH